MTYREKITIEHPEMLNGSHPGGVVGCPFSYGYEKREHSYCFTKQARREPILRKRCEACWDRKIRKEKEK